MQLEAGNVAPEFSLEDQHGKSHNLKDYRGKWVVLYFYPKDDTSGCTKEACGFRDSRSSFDEKNAVVLGVSADTVQSHEKFANKYDLPFPLLSDPDKTAIEAYNVWQEKNMYGKKRMGIVRSTFVIDPDGNVAKAWYKVKVAGHTEQVLEVVG
jgi:thioredoxin-dependent peroxiredoxin